MKLAFRLFVAIVTFLFFTGCKAQTVQLTSAMPDTIPYAQIPEYPESFSGKNVVARMIDGLGFRYYWATEGLTDDDLSYKPSEDGRATIETLEHVFGLAEGINNAALNKPNLRPSPELNMTFGEMRKATLNLLYGASQELKTKSGSKLSEMKVIFKRVDRESSFDFWHLINGQIADALWHTGQIVSFRRASGNPLDPGVNVFMGTQK